MSKIVVSVMFSLVLAGGLVTGLVLAGRSKDSCRTCERTGEELALVRDELAALREDTRGLLREVHRIQSLPRAESVTGSEQLANPAGADRPASDEVALADRPEEIKGYLLAALEQDRKQREEERQQQREQQKEEAKQRAEAKRQEQAELKEGPYDKFNVKVNSAAKALGLSESQKQAYYELLKSSREKVSEARKSASTEVKAEGASAESGKGKGREEFKKMREVMESAQKDFAAQVQAILSPAQLETYKSLPDGAHSFLSLGSVSESGDGNRSGGGAGDGFGALNRRRSGGPSGPGGR